MFCNNLLHWVGHWAICCFYLCCWNFNHCEGYEGFFWQDKGSKHWQKFYELFLVSIDWTLMVLPVLWNDFSWTDAFFEWVWWFVNKKAVNIPLVVYWLIIKYRIFATMEIVRMIWWLVFLLGDEAFSLLLLELDVKLGIHIKSLALIGGFVFKLMFLMCFCKISSINILNGVNMSTVCDFTGLW